ncbi:4-hydroxy-tetrahydrodipicolinate synthase [Ornithinibacillus sp. 4-3]|uniref:4-hydroxy-tetrahydrodipicolinate synthase n=1 Tax=Ornithinibacillus sp. 4-3 TaxID=3231488 RepID=A0AB39HNA4_9BACI
MDFGKIITAMVTPFDLNGEIDYPATKNLINHLIANGSDAIVVAGTTGESPTLSFEEKLALIRYTVEAVDGRIKVIAGTGSNNTRESIILTKKVEALEVDGIMLVTPYYNKPSQAGMYEHFKAIAEITHLPIMLYNIPGRSVVNMEVDTVVALSKIKNIVSIKEASGNLNAMAEIIERTPESFTLYSGDDGLTLPVLAIGGAGVVSVASHVIGNQMQEMFSNFETGQVKEAAKIHRQLLPFMEALFFTPSPTSLKEVLNTMDIPVGSVRLPLVPLNKEEKQVLKKYIQFLIKKAS